MGTIKTLRDTSKRDRSRSLRRNDTRAEAKLWNALRARRLGGWQWRRQVSIGPYFVDFLCIETELVVEVDGGQHSEQIAYDAARTAYLQRAGYRVLRFWNSAVLTNRDGVCTTILDACGGDSPRPPRSEIGEAGRGAGGT